ncbi:MAG: LysM peptidoglycan-binding domain-containing protein [Nibricoccus sp.]
MVLIAGGKDKGFEYEMLTELVAAGAAQSWSRRNGRPHRGDLEDRVAGSQCRMVPGKSGELSHDLAQPGDVVLFSPGTSSFDMFKNYADRGNQFRALVKPYLPNETANPEIPEAASGLPAAARETETDEVECGDRACMRPGMEDDFDDEPQTRLSSAFFVVLILHVVAVGGIYAFNSIKAHRRGFEPTVAATKAAPSEKSEPAEAPVKTQAAPAAAPAAPAPSLAAQPSNARYYHVKTGDTLPKIAAATGVSVAELQFQNTGKDLATLKNGQILNLPPKKATAQPVQTAAIEPPAPNPVVEKKTDTAATKTAAPGTYTIQKGDTATSIAKRFGVTVDDLSS